MSPDAITALLLVCAPHVDPLTAGAIVTVESARNPYAIGVVGGSLVRQPQNRGEARATATALSNAGWNFSLGLTQINVRNLERLGLDRNTAFEPCANLRAMQSLLTECADRGGSRERGGQVGLRRILSCYYAGDFSTGFRDGYVQRVVVAAARSLDVRPPSHKEMP